MKAKARTDLEVKARVKTQNIGEANCLEQARTVYYTICDPFLFLCQDRV